jgi:hypothetical protein
MHQGEGKIQEAVAIFLRCHNPYVLFTVSNGGIRLTIGQAVKMKRMGYQKGTPDIMIFEPRNKYHGLFIELKDDKGTLKDHQQEYLDHLERRGYFAVACYGYQETIDVIEKYLKLN